MDYFIPIILFIGGLIGGLYAANIGGMGLLSLPLLLLVDMPTLQALATHKFAAVILELASTIKFYKEKKLHWRLGIFLGLIAAIGAVIGTNIVININQNFLNIIVGVLLVVAAVVILKEEDNYLSKSITPKLQALNYK